MVDVQSQIFNFKTFFSQNLLSVNSFQERFENHYLLQKTQTF